eukprot:GGOE01005020.1.p1 GENE.GGOE01005020.1~~GGOE01005020.1.p1  ORF type:complete len:535 (-),score=147.46 GGOE01005020.1:527-2110(-)
MADFIWWKALISFFLICFSAIFSGLTLGLMGQDITQLTVLANSAAPCERRWANKVLPVRKKGNLLLCTLLLGNVMVNAALSIFMSEMTGGLLGLLASTFFIVVFGEIIPQATCSRYSLRIGSALIIPVKIFIVLLYPIAKPISMVLNWFLGTDMGQIYDRNELVQLLEMHAERTKETGIGRGETKLMKAAMEFSNATVQDIMTKIDDVYMLEADTRLDADVMTSIWQTGHSRVPVYEESVNNICGVLFVKDLTLLDPADEMPLHTLLHFYPRELHMVFSDTKLPELMKYFQTGQGHLAIVRSVNSEGDGDPFYENTGIVTLEDIIEFLIRDEIVDETDVYVDLETKQRVKRHTPWGNQLCAVRLTPHQVSACASFLNSSVPAFGKGVFDMASVTRIVAEANVRDLKVTDEVNPRASRKLELYTRGQPSEWFTLILSGKVDVVTGVDKFHCKLGAWDWLAVHALTEEKYIPDFTALVSSNCRVLQVPRQRYLKAVYLYGARTKKNANMMMMYDAALPTYPELRDSKEI